MQVSVLADILAALAARGVEVVSEVVPIDAVQKEVEDEVGGLVDFGEEVVEARVDAMKEEEEKRVVSDVESDETKVEVIPVVEDKKKVVEVIVERERLVAVPLVRPVAVDKEVDTVSDSSGRRSWADEMEEEEREGRARLGEVPVKGERTGVNSDVETKNFGFYKSFVRTDRVEALARKLSEITGFKFRKDARFELALASSTAAAVPSEFFNGRDRLKALAVVGDAAIGLALVARAYRKGLPLSSVQELKSVVASNQNMQTKFSGCVLAQHVFGGTGAVLSKTKTGADVCEAIAGFLYLKAGVAAVEKYVDWLGL